jgi:protein CpxP
MNYFNKNKWWLIAVIVLLVVNTATLTIFWLERKSHGLLMGGKPKGAEAQAYLIKELALDSAQQVQYLALVKAHRRGTNEIKHELKNAKDAFFNLLGDSTANEATIKQAADQASAIETQLDVLTFKHFQQIRSICTPAQKVKFDSVIKTVVKMMGPSQQRPQGPLPPNGMHQGERPNGPPPHEGEGPPPPHDGNGPPPPNQ